MPGDMAEGILTKNVTSIPYKKKGGKLTNSEGVKGGIPNGIPGFG